MIQNTFIGVPCVGRLPLKYWYKPLGAPTKRNWVCPWEVPLLLLSNYISPWEQSSLFWCVALVGRVRRRVWHFSLISPCTTYSLHLLIYLISLGMEMESGFLVWMGVGGDANFWKGSLVGFKVYLFIQLYWPCAASFHVMGSTMRVWISIHKRATWPTSGFLEQLNDFINVRRSHFHEKMENISWWIDCRTLKWILQGELCMVIGKESPLLCAEINLYSSPLLLSTIEPLIANLKSKFSNYIMCGKEKIYVFS